MRPADTIQHAIDHIHRAEAIPHAHRAVDVLRRAQDQIGRPSGYYIEIRTAPHDHWHHPQSWRADDRREADRMLARARDLWMDARLVIVGDVAAEMR